MNWVLIFGVYKMVNFLQELMVKAVMNIKKLLALMLLSIGVYFIYAYGDRKDDWEMLNLAHVAYYEGRALKQNFQVESMG